MNATTAEIDVIEIEGRQAVRVPEGKEPEEDEKVSLDQLGSMLTALALQFFPQFKLSFLRDNAWRPNITSMLESLMFKVFQNDIVELGFHGVADDYTGATRGDKWLRLNKGWIQLSKESDSTHKLDLDISGLIQATAGTGTVVDKNALTWTATSAGSTGNDLRVEIVAG
ncbi:MAG: hypothetical protein GY862_38505, partial [Gammaproteobacteria bacterium]|nr:hypothetical protein [Gammaproteobacteria bacterium]